MNDREQFRLAIGDEAFDSLPDASTYRPRTPRQRRPRLEARHRLALSGYVPARVACGFTTAETAVLAIIAIEHKKHGRCDLTQAKIGRDANASRGVVQNATYQAEHWGLIKVERSKVDRARNRPNVITIVSKTWLAWLLLGPSRPRPWGIEQDARAIGAAGHVAQPVVGIVLSAQRLQEYTTGRKQEGGCARVASNAPTYAGAGKEAGKEKESFDKRAAARAALREGRWYVKRERPPDGSGLKFAHPRGLQGRRE